MIRFPKTAALAAGLVSATGFAPLGLWPVTLACFVLLIALIAEAPDWRGGFARTWLFGVGHFTLGLNWIAHAFDFQDAMPHWLGYIAVFLLSLYLAVYPAIGALVAWLVARPKSVADGASAGRGSFVLIFAGLWIVTEYLRATMFTGFAWNPLSAISVGLPTMAYAKFVGTYGLSGLIVALAGMVWWAVLLLTAPGKRSAVEFAASAVAAGAAVLFYVGFPAAQMGQPAHLAVRDAAPAVRIVQHNTSQAERHDKGYDEKSVVTLEQLSGLPGRQPRLVFWPEAASPYFLEEERWALERVAKLLGPRDLLLTGGEALVFGKAGKLIAARNSLFVITPDARIVGRYDKAHLVPYGEYLPMRPLLTAIGLSRLVPGDLDFWPGPGPMTLQLPGFGSMGGQICYEIVFSGEVIDRAHRPDFIFNPSTDAWFGRWGPPQHLAQARLRAAEEGLPVLRSTPTGISAVVDADGRLIAALPLDKPGFIASILPPPHPPTLFARHGNLLPFALALVLLIAGVAPRFIRR